MTYPMIKRYYHNKKRHMTSLPRYGVDKVGLFWSISTSKYYMLPTCLHQSFCIVVSGMFIQMVFMLRNGKESSNRKIIVVLGKLFLWKTQITIFLYKHNGGLSRGPWEGFWLCPREFFGLFYVYLYCIGVKCWNVARYVAFMVS
jgi:hypothetical protein